MKNLKITGIISNFTFQGNKSIVDLLSVNNNLFFSTEYHVLGTFTFDHHL